MRSIVRVVVAGAAALLLGGCLPRPTRVTTTWRAPDAQPAHFRRTAAVFVGGDAALRRLVEDQLAAQIPNGFASHVVIPDSQLAAADTQTIRATLTENGIDGAVVLRLVRVDSETVGVPAATSATPGEGLWEYLLRIPRSALSPARQRTITAACRLYAVPTGTLLWAGQSESFNPLSMEELVAMIVDASLWEVRRQGLL